MCQSFEERSPLAARLKKDADEAKKGAADEAQAAAAPSADAMQVGAASQLGGAAKGADRSN